MLKKIFLFLPIERLLLYFLLFSLLPVAGIVFHFSQKRGVLKRYEQRIEEVRLLSLQKEQKQALNQLVRKHYSNAEPLYLDLQLESLTFLKKEREALEALFKSKTFTGNEAAESRYQFILGETNRLRFSQSAVQTAEGIQETTEILSHPVEVDDLDLKEILSRIEGKRHRMPQLIITDFKLTKKRPLERSEVYELNMKLLKREFLIS